MKNLDSSMVKAQTSKRFSTSPEDNQWQTWDSAPKKGPHKSPKYSVFPALFEENMGLVGAFFGGPIQMENLQQPGLKTAYMQAA